VLTRVATEFGLSLIDLGINSDRYDGLEDAMKLQDIQNNLNGNETPSDRTNIQSIVDVQNAAVELSAKVDNPITHEAVFNTLAEQLRNSNVTSEEQLTQLIDLLKQNQANAETRMNASPVGSEQRDMEMQNTKEYNQLITSIGNLITELQQ
jgi:hypothetical protein